MQKYSEYVKRHRENSGHVFIDNKEFVFLRDPQTVKMQEGRCKTIAICPSEAAPSKKITESNLKTVNVSIYLIEWKVLNVEDQPESLYECDWESPFNIIEKGHIGIVDDLEEHERSTMYYIDNNLTLEIDGKLFLLKGRRERHDNYFRMQVSCETDKSYWRGMIAWPQYEFIWDISNENKSSNPKDWDRPRKITNLHKIVIKERALHMVLDDPNVCDDIKDYWWSQEYDILKK